jgi:hypothetical protein
MRGPLHRVLERLEEARMWLKAHRGLAQGAAYLILAFGVVAALHLNSDELGARHSAQQSTNQRFAEQKDREATAAKRTAENSAINRAVNVETWCEGNGPRAASLNGIVRYDRRFVLTVSGGKLRYTLRPNECEKIIVETLESGARKTTITRKNHPLVWKALLHTRPK